MNLSIIANKIKLYIESTWHQELIGLDIRSLAYKDLQRRRSNHC